MGKERRKSHGVGVMSMMMIRAWREVKVLGVLCGVYGVDTYHL